VKVEEVEVERRRSEREEKKLCFPFSHFFSPRAEKEKKALGSRLVPSKQLSSHVGPPRSGATVSSASLAEAAESNGSSSRYCRAGVLGRGVHRRRRFGGTLVVVMVVVACRLRSRFFFFVDLALGH